jgi:hypothetical protein
MSVLSFCRVAWVGFCFSDHRLVGGDTHYETSRV